MQQFMGRRGFRGLGQCALAAVFLFGATCSGAVHQSAPAVQIPLPLSSYPAMTNAPLHEVLATRVRVEPFNLIATIIFLLAIVHTFLAPMFTRLSHRLQKEHAARLGNRAQPASANSGRGEVSFRAEVFHFLGEVEAVFGIWVVPLLIVLACMKGWGAGREYLGAGLNFTEPFFVVVIMTMSASRPILRLSEFLMGSAARLGGSTQAAWWFSILTVGPLLGSFITEPAAMTISALMLARKFYERRPGATLAYATLGLLFVNISVGGTLTHFAAPPVLMVAGTWGWGFSYMLTHFGWKAVLAILLSNVIFLVIFSKEFRWMDQSSPQMNASHEHADGPVPFWITAVHVLFLFWTVLNNHYPALFVGGFLFYLAFAQATEQHQCELSLRPALLVGFFLAGLVVHGGLQGWWIQPLLTRLNEVPLFVGAAGLTAFNDNAAITYLASLVPGFSETSKYAVLAGAVVGGGLTVIANAPNPAGQSILATHFPDGVSPFKLFLGALAPTVITGAIFLLFR